VAAAARQAAAGPAAGPLTGSLGALAAELALDQALAPFVSPDGRRARLTLFVPITGFDRLDPLTRAALETARQAFPQAAVEVTGQHPLLLETQRQLLSTLTSSFALTLVCVALILRYLVGDRTLALAALVPNVWPVLGVLGAMGWFGVPLDVATVMVASVILGLAVSDTVHTLGHFRELAPQVGRFEAVASTLHHTAGAYVLTGGMLIAGFGVCGLSSFAPTARFGLLSGAGIFLAVVGDLFLVPALLGGRAGRAPRRGSSRESSPTSV
jgi:predicted RND superfamily exporter protein